ncbi:MAG: hypothetical protein RLZZ524_999, partial [Pseudomonadota bacterium]
LHVDPLQIEPVLEQLAALDWIGRLDEDGAGRIVLLADPQLTSLGPLCDALLLAPQRHNRAFAAALGWQDRRLADALGEPA